MNTNPDWLLFGFEGVTQSFIDKQAKEFHGY